MATTTSLINESSHPTSSISPTQHSSATGDAGTNDNSLETRINNKIAHVEQYVVNMYNQVMNHPTTQKITTNIPSKQELYNRSKPMLNTVFSESTQNDLSQKLTRGGQVVHKYRQEYTYSMESYLVELINYTTSSSTLSLLVGYLLTTHIILPLLYISTDEAEIIMMTTVSGIFVSHVLYSIYGMRPILFASFLVEIPLLLYLWSVSGIGGKYAAELALSIDSMQDSNSSSKVVLGNKWYLFVLWLRGTMIGIAAMLPTVLQKAKNDYIAMKNGDVSVNTNDIFVVAQSHNSADGEQVSSVDNAIKQSIESQQHKYQHGYTTVNATILVPNTVRQVQVPLQQPSSISGNSSNNTRSPQQRSGPTHQQSQQTEEKYGSGSSQPSSSVQHSTEQEQIYLIPKATSTSSVQPSTAAELQGVIPLTNPSADASSIPPNARKLGTADSSLYDSNTQPVEQNPDRFHISTPDIQSTQQTRYGTDRSAQPIGNTTVSPTGTGQTLGDVASNVSTNLSNIANRYVKQAKSAINDVSTHGTDSNTVQSVKQSITPNQSTLSALSHTIHGDKDQNEYSGERRPLSDVLPSQQTVKQTVNTAGNVASNIGTQVYQSMPSTEQVKSTATNVVNTVAESDTYKSVKQSAYEITQQAKEQASEIGDAAKQTTSNITQQGSDKSKEISESTRSTASNLTVQAQQFSSNTVPSANSTVNDYIDSGRNLSSYPITPSSTTQSSGSVKPIVDTTYERTNVESTRVTPSGTTTPTTLHTPSISSNSITTPTYAESRAKFENMASGRSVNSASSAPAVIQSNLGITHTQIPIDTHTPSVTSISADTPSTIYASGGTATQQDPIVEIVRPDSKTLVMNPSTGEQLDDGSFQFLTEQARNQRQQQTY